MTLQSEISINATAERVWQVIVSFNDYQYWNPAIPSAQGNATRGSILRVVIQWPRLGPSNYALEVLAAIPGRELRWLGHYKIVGLLDGDHSFMIESIGKNRVRVTQAENFSGVLVPLFARWLRANVLEGFGLMNAALKSRAEDTLAGRVQ